MRFLVIGDEDTVLAFALLGIEGVVTGSPSDTRKALYSAIKREEIGIILITESLGKQIKGFIEHILGKKKCHLILQIPEVNGPSRTTRSVEGHVCSALGVKI